MRFSIAKNNRIILSVCFACAFLFASCDTAMVRDAVMPRIAGSAAPNEAAAGGLKFTERTPYDANTAVVVNTTVDVYAEADRTSARLTQILFDEPVQILEQTDLWARMRVDDRIDGWVRTRGLDGDWTCIDKRRYSERIIITDREKQIYSHPRNGIVIRDVGMGTELFVVSKSSNVYQVALPGNLTGWISENGVFQLDAYEDIKKTTAEIFAQSCSKFRGTSYLLGGLSFHGVDGAGMIYVASKINGVRLPRDYDGQYSKGEFVYDGLDALEIGDVLFFSSNNQSTVISDAGVYIGEGQFIHANQHTGKVQYEDVGDLFVQQRILGVKRYF